MALQNMCNAPAPQKTGYAVPPGEETTGLIHYSTAMVEAIPHFAVPGNAVKKSQIINVLINSRLILSVGIHEIWYGFATVIIKER
ncbi:hypothetical protein DXN05_15235 [Deminuibacter soli]|uniref:Uncharacterized protein n=1 Tax=Deminuibacter soli TaxID=2291815 RepID=A0A3E1NHE4_9BACT|nr:hypothetical protein DXN05_15235 [Deminuibacter soli]